jgi:hypothetical protein
MKSMVLFFPFGAVPFPSKFDWLKKTPLLMSGSHMGVTLVEVAIVVTELAAGGTGCGRLSLAEMAMPVFTTNDSGLLPVTGAGLLGHTNTAICV